MTMLDLYQDPALVQDIKADFHVSLEGVIPIGHATV